MNQIADYRPQPLDLPTAGRAPAARPPAGLSRRAKAAVIVRLLLSDGADLPIEDLPEDLQALLTEEMGKLRIVDRDTLCAVADEFADTLESVGVAFSGGISGAISAMDGKISPAAAARLRRQAGVAHSGDPWAAIRAAPVDTLATVALAETIEVAAVMLSKLDTAKAAALLGKLPGPQARRITYAVSRTNAITPEAVRRIGLALLGALDARPVPAFDDAPAQRVGAILSSSRPNLRDDVLGGLDEADAEFARHVRKAIFTFAHIPARMPLLSVPVLLREAPQQTVATALASCTADPDKETAEFLLSGISTRMADSLREEMEALPNITPRDGDTARSEIVTLIRELAEKGEITLTTSETSQEDES